jgi:flagellar FliL protein
MIIIVAAALVLGGGGGGAFFFMKKKGGNAEEEVAHKVDPQKAPTYLPLDPMVVNLADPAGDRYAQVGVTLEISDPKVAEQVKAFLPTIRNGILLVVSQKTMAELLMPEGKEKLANEILAEVSRPLGFEVESEDEAPAKADKKKKKKPARHNPIERVLFSSLIVQ